MNKRLSVVLVTLCVGNGLLVAGDASQQKPEQETCSPSKLLLIDARRVGRNAPVPNGGIDKPNNYGYTELMHAVIGGYADSVGELLGQGANVNRANNVGSTPIAFAVLDVCEHNRLLKHRMLTQLLRQSPSLDSVGDVKHEKSPKAVLKELQGCYPPVPASVRLLDMGIQEEEKRRAKIEQQRLLQASTYE